MTTKTVMTYTVFGVSFYNGAHRLRFSNNMEKRMATLVALGDTDVNIQELPGEMHKLDACNWAQASGKFEAEHEKKLIAAFIEKNTAKTDAAPKKRGRPRKAVAAVVTLDETAAVDEAGTAAQDDVQLDEVLNAEGTEEMSDDELLALLAAEDAAEEVAA